MDIRNRMADVSKLRCNVCQDFLRMVAQPNWQQQLYAKAKCEVEASTRFRDKYISDLCIEASFGDKVIDEIAAYISDAAPAIKGFNRRGLYRMKQFYETYKDDEFVSAVLTQISWTRSRIFCL